MSKTCCTLKNGSNAASLPNYMKPRRNFGNTKLLHNVCRNWAGVQSGSIILEQNLLKRDCCSNEQEPVKTRVRYVTKKQLTPKTPWPQAKVVSKEKYEEIRESIRDEKLEEQKKASLFAAEEERERLLKESMERREEFRRIDLMMTQEKSGKLSEIEDEARKRTMHVLERARNMRIEQEEELQKCNRIILETKCRAVRDAQIAEKKLIAQELADEETRLNDMMENERRWSIKEELRKEQEEVAKRHAFANLLKDQIVENEEQRILNFARKQEESRLINLSNIAWQQEEIAKLSRKEADNARARNDIAEGNQQLKNFRAMEEQENKIIDIRIQEYQRQKDEREAKALEERKLEKIKKEEEKSRIAMQAQETQRLQARIEEMNIARIQEEVERTWREKEREQVFKRAEAQKNLLKEREDQINNKRIMQAIELERERREFEKIVRVQKEAFCREQKDLEKKQRQALIHRNEILKQVNEKERERIIARQKMFGEGLAIRTEAEMRRKKLRAAMESKCLEMRSNNVPEMYINEVKRMIENIQ